MDVIMKCFFNDIFSSLKRDCLLPRFKRRELIEYLSTVIEGCCKAEGAESDVMCNEAVLSAINYHSSEKLNNGDICMLGKYHNVLYIAAKLCFDWKLNNDETVCELLNNIFKCEKSFERFFSGPIFGVKLSHVLAGWKSDFIDPKEDIQALKYFIDKAMKGRCLYDLNNQKLRFIDVPLASYGDSTPAGVCIQAGEPEILLLVLRYGANISLENKDETLLPSLQLLGTISRYLTLGAQVPREYLQCLIILLRVVPSVSPLIAVYAEVYPEYPLHSDLINKYIPETRSGKIPPELKHLCRLVIRNELNKNFQLPYGIEELSIPLCLKDYLNLQDQS